MRTRHDAPCPVIVTGAPMADLALMEHDSFFCANIGCNLHVRPGDPNVHGSGNWARFEDGTLLGRRRVDSTMLCDRCANRVMRGEVTLSTRRATCA